MSRLASGSGASSTSTIGPSVRDRASSRGAAARLWVPKTTSTQWARSRIGAAVLLGHAAADGDLQVGDALPSAPSAGRARCRASGRRSRGSCRC